MFLKQSTSAVVIVGQVLDASGNPVTTAVIGDFTLTKNGTSATMSGNTISHSHNGHYAITLTTANTDTVGRLAITINNASYAMAAFRWDVCQPTVFDAMFANATNSTGGLLTATGSVTALAGAISTLTAAGVRTELTTELGRIDTTVSSRLATSGYTAPPSAATNATAVRTELATELARIDVSISSRSTLTAGGVRTELTTELGRIDAAISSRMATYTQPTGFLAATFPATVSSFAGGAVASVTGSVGSISGVTFPTHFANLEITANGHVSAVVQSIANNSITASSIQGGAITAAKFAADAITASALAADAVQEIRSGLALAADLLIVSDRVSYSLAVLVGACSDAQTAAETYTLTIGGNTFTVDYTGLDSSGNRSTTTLSKV